AGVFLELRYSPDGKSLYGFTDEVLIFDRATLQQVATWGLSLPSGPELGHFDMGRGDDVNDDRAAQRQAPGADSRGAGEPERPFRPADVASLELDDERSPEDGIQLVL